MKTNTNILRGGFVTLFLVLVLAASAATDVAGVIRMSGSGDTVAASPSPINPTRYIESVRLYSSAGLKHFKLRAGTASDGTLLFQGYTFKDDADTTFSSGTDQFQTITGLNIEVPASGLYLETDSNTTSGGLYLYTRKSGTR